MRNISDWGSSAISLMGDPSKKRSTVTKAILVGLLGIMTAKAVIAPVNSYVDADLQARGGIEHSQIKTHLDEVGKKLNIEYGTDKTVIVLTNDPALKFIVANAQAQFMKDDFGYATKTGQYRTKAANFMEEKLGISVDKEMVRRNNLYTDLVNDSHGPMTTLLGERSENPYDGLVFINGWGGTDMMDYRHRFPFHFDLESQNSFSFFHELTHAVDTRDGRAHVNQFANEDNILNSEAIADLGTALLFHQKTGNMDEWNYNIRPARLALSQDIVHSTSTIVDRALESIDLSKTDKMSDREIMVFAKEQVNSLIADMNLVKEHAKENPNDGMRKLKYTDWTYMRRVEASYAQPNDVSDFAHGLSIRWLDRITEGNGAAVTRNHGREVMEASLNNLAYNGKFAQHSEDFVNSLAKHISQYDDKDAAKAFSVAMAGGKFDEKVFAREMHFNIDYDSALRKEGNDQILHGYFTEKTGMPALAGFEMKAVENNVKASVMGRYAEKAVDYVLSKSDMDLKWP